MLTIRLVEHGSAPYEETVALRYDILRKPLGIGFTADQAERLFQPFQQGDNSNTRAHGGTGLGLAISRELVNRMGGTITAEGRPGEGATFRVELPLPRIRSAA